MADEAPEQSYYPRAKVRLIVRFEEFGSSETVRRQAPPVPTTVLNGTKTDRAPLVAKQDPDAPPGVRKFVLAANTSPRAKGGPQAQTKSSDGLTHVVEGIIPKTMAVNYNGLRAADTLNVDLRLIDCPVDPRTIRSCAIEAMLGTITADDHASGVGGGVRGTKRAGGGVGVESLLVVPDSYVDEQGRQRTNVRFQGFVDKWETDWPEDGEPLIHLECRDNTQLLIDQEAPAKLVVGMKKPIDEAIADYLANFPQFEGLSVEYRPASAKPPQLDKILAGTAYRPNLGPPVSKGGGGSSKLSVWDYLTDVCGAIGHNVRMEGTTIVVQLVSTLIGGKGGRRDDDPFAGRSINGVFSPHRRFIYGRNILTMKIARAFSKRAPTNVEVRAYSTRRKKTLVVRFPEKSDRVVGALPGDGGAEQKWLVWKISGIEDLAVMKSVAQTIYQSVGRNELTVDIKTKNLASFGGGNLDPDVLDMLAADTFELLVRRDEDYSGTTTRIEDALAAQARAVDFMKALGYEGAFADAYAKAYTDANFQTEFRLKSMSMSWDADEEAIAIDLHGGTYVEVRMDAPFEEKDTQKDKAVKSNRDAPLPPRRR